MFKQFQVVMLALTIAVGILRAFYRYLGRAVAMGDIPGLERSQVLPNGKFRYKKEI